LDMGWIEVENGWRRLRRSVTRSWPAQEQGERGRDVSPMGSLC